jgi:hypothetical protein
MLVKKKAFMHGYPIIPMGNSKTIFPQPAKDPLSNLPQLRYTSYSSIRYREMSVGLKHYFIGAYDSEISGTFMVTLALDYC